MTDLIEDRHFLQKLHKLYPRALLGLIALQFVNEGFVMMKLLAIMDLLKRTYGQEPSAAQNLRTLIFLPSMLKLICGLVVDAKLVKKRKHYLIAFGLLQTITYMIITFFNIPEVGTACAILMLNHFTTTFMDSTVESIQI